MERATPLRMCKNARVKIPKNIGEGGSFSLVNVGSGFFSGLPSCFLYFFFRVMLH